MASVLYDSIEALSRDKGIDPQIVVSAVEDAIALATRKYYKTQENMRAELDRQTGEIRAYVFKTVVESPEQIEDPINQIALEEARAIAPEVEVGGEIRYFKPTDVLGRNPSASDHPVAACAPGRRSKLRNQARLLDIRQTNLHQRRAFLPAPFRLLPHCTHIQPNRLLIDLCEPSLPVPVARHRIERPHPGQHSLKAAEIFVAPQLAIQPRRGNLQRVLRPRNQLLHIQHRSEIPAENLAVAVRDPSEPVDFDSGAFRFLPGRKLLPLFRVLLNEDAQRAVFRPALEFDIHYIKPMRSRNSLRRDTDLIDVEGHNLLP